MVTIVTVTSALCPHFKEIYIFVSVKGVTLIFISGHGSAFSPAKQGKSGSIYNLVKN